MDYFDTAKKYRNKRIKKLISVVINIIVLSIVAIIAWQIGVRDRNNIIAVHSSELIRIANDFKELNDKLENLRIQSENDSVLITKLKIELSDKPGNKLNEIIKLSSSSISKGVSIEQITASIKSLNKPTKCLKPIRKELNVITPIYSTNSHEISVFNNGMFILAEGQANIEANNINPWFDENKPIKVRIRYFGIEQWFNGLLPFTTKIPFQDNIVIINFERSDVRGSIYTTIKVCS
tara:strand:+ start:1079 stop:1786 length:708 start_codon:yes stop_codon:yes gene_type:complete